MPEIIKAIIFGIVEGITEWLPISSTGHMIILSEFIRLEVSDEFYSMFQVVIQLGAILAVVVLFWHKLWPFAGSRDLRSLQGKDAGSRVRKDVYALWLRILVSCVPAAAVGLLFDDVLEEYFYNYTTVAVMLILFGIAFIIIENVSRNRSPEINSVEDITYKTALLIGLFQLIAAVLPGTSRSGATIVGALLIGVSRTAAAEYTFLLAVPVMLGASLLKILKFGSGFSASEAVILSAGMAAAFAVSMAVIKFLMGYIRAHDFKPFGWYRIALGLIVLVLGVSGAIGA